jgi:pyruvate,water dikinase
VRSSAIGEDSELASAAGQYQSILNVTSRPALQEAITQVLASYHNPTAIQYRQDFAQANRSASGELPDQSMAVLIQQQIQGAFSGVAFSRDPISQQGDAVIIEGLPEMPHASSLVELLQSSIESIWHKTQHRKPNPNR